MARSNEIYLSIFIIYCNLYVIAVVTCPDLCNCKFDPAGSGVSVDCAHRNLSKIPDDIPINTATLTLRGNNLDCLKNFSFAKLTVMETLDLSHNIIYDLQENTFQNLTNLRKLDLSANCLFSTKFVYPPGIFIPLLRLVELHLESKHITFSKCERLSSLLLTERLKNKMNLNTLSGISDLSKIRTMVSKEQYSMQTAHDTTQDYYPDVALSHLVNLQELSLDIVKNNYFQSGFRKLTKLTSLRLRSPPSFNTYVVINETFMNVPHLKRLDLSDCGIYYLGSHSFSALKELTILNLSRNALDFNVLGLAFQGLAKTKLQILNITLIKLGVIERITLNCSHLRYMKYLTSLHTVYAMFNTIEGFDDGVLCSCVPTSLRNVYLDHNVLAFRPNYIKEFQCLENLEILSIENFEIQGYIFPENNYNSVDKQRKHPLTSPFRVQGQERIYDETFTLPPKLQVLKVRRAGLMSWLQFQKPFNPNNSLHSVHAGNNYFPSWNIISGLNKLTHLHLEYVSCTYITPVFFRHLPQVKSLELSGNSMKSIFEALPGQNIFANTEFLEKLKLSAVDIDAIPNGTFSTMKRLESLDLSFNRLKSFEENISHMTNLTCLNLTQNQLSTLPQAARDHLDKVSETYNVTVDLTFNPIACMCSNIDFLRWMRDSKVFFGKHTDYVCVQSDGWRKQMEDIYSMIAHLERQCGDYTGMFFGASASCILFVFILLVALAYRYRWKLRYLYYATRLNFQRQRTPQDVNFDFDVFVSFASEDTNFVMGEMKIQLEDNFGLTLCIHIRDFTPGQYIATNILDAIQNSRRTLVVLTRALLESDWCNYELQMALMEGAHTGRDVLLFLLYEDIPKHELSRDILLNIQSCTYLEFPHTEDDRGPFWNRLAGALKE